MKAVVYTHYGPRDVLTLADVDTPTLTDGDVLIRVRAAAVNPGDWDLLHRTPYVLRPSTGPRQLPDGVLDCGCDGQITGHAWTWFGVGT